MKTAMTLVLAALYAVSASPLDTFSCNPLLDDVDYKSKLSVKTNQSSAEDCCKDCRNREAFCDFFVWTTENDGTCELKRFKFPLTKVDRPGVRSSVMEHCRCTDGEGCGDDGVCTGCMFGGSNGKCSKESDGACSHAGGKVCSASLTARPTGTPTDEKCRCTQGDGCTLDGACNGCLAYNNCYITDGFCTHGSGIVCGTPSFATTNIPTNDTDVVTSTPTTSPSDASATPNPPSPQSSDAAPFNTTFPPTTIEPESPAPTLPLSSDSTQNSQATTDKPATTTSATAKSSSAVIGALSGVFLLCAVFGSNFH